MTMNRTDEYYDVLAVLCAHCVPVKVRPFFGLQAEDKRTNYGFSLGDYITHRLIAARPATRIAKSHSCAEIQ